MSIPPDFALERLLLFCCGKVGGRLGGFEWYLGAFNNFWYLLITTYFINTWYFGRGNFETVTYSGRFSISTNVKYLDLFSIQANGFYGWIHLGSSQNPRVLQDCHCHLHDGFTQWVATENMMVPFSIFTSVIDLLVALHPRNRLEMFGCDMFHPSFFSQNEFWIAFFTASEQRWGTILKSIS